MTSRMDQHTITTRKRLIGRREEIDLPEWDLFGIDAKVDTGAYTSSLHCHHIEEIAEEGGEKKVQFNLLDPSHEAYNEKQMTLRVFDEKKVKSSNAQIESRYIVKTNVFIFDRDYEIELSLTDRSEMKYPILLGRRFLQKKFIVDVSKVNISKKEIQKNNHHADRNTVSE